MPLFLRFSVFSEESGLFSSFCVFRNAPAPVCTDGSAEPLGADRIGNGFIGKGSSLRIGQIVHGAISADPYPGSAFHSVDVRCEERNSQPYFSRSCSIIALTSSLL